jgi:DNA-binding transcriptional ArsR family regulator
MNPGVMHIFDLLEPKTNSGDQSPTSQSSDAATLDIGRKAVFAVVASPLRMRIFEIIRRVGECSVRELSVQSGLSTTGLYYHLQALEHLELIRQIGVRKGDARRAPAVYAATCERVRILFNPDDGTHRSRMATVRRRWNDESMQSLEDTVSLFREGKSPRVRQSYEWEQLTSEEIDEISRLFAQVEAICDRARARGNVLPDGARPVHLGLHLCELESVVMPSPLMRPEPHRRGASLGDLVNRIDHARSRQTATTA